MGQHDREFFARCASGFEQVLAQELRTLGMRRVRPLKGGVAFFGSMADGYRACLWSRVATRIQLVLARVPAHDADALYAHVAALAWEDHVRHDATIAVQAHGTNAHLRKTTFTALKAKDALCDHLRSVWGTRPNVDAKHPDFALNVALHEQKATLFLNLSGESLHRRGYREDGTQTEAPLKETLAAGMLLSAGWPALEKDGGCLVDPMCGSGTLAIEAALMAAHQAPGLLRASWGFEGWAQHDPGLWEELLAEARDKAERPHGKPRIVAGDLDPEALEIAKANACRARVEGFIAFHCDDAANLGRHIRRMRNNPSVGLLVANPPYGRRLLSEQDLPATYAALEKAVGTVPSHWELALITPDAGIDSALGRLPHEVLPCFNGPIEVGIRRYHLSEPQTCLAITAPTGVQCNVPLAESGSAQFASRLRKVSRERAKWAKRAGISCYRVYDADLPDYRFFVDLYAGHEPEHTVEQNAPTLFAYVEEYRRPASVHSDKATHRLSDAAAIIAATLGIHPSNVVVCPWSNAPSNSESSRAPQDRHLVVADENALAVTLDINRPAAALPLAQRSLRSLAAEHAAGQRIACLFATGAVALARAARAGARQTVLVDGSKAHLGTARDLFRTNGLTNRSHKFELRDVRSWVQDAQRRHERYDLILCFAPQWLPEKDAGTREWDAQQDLVALLSGAAQLLTKAGRILLVPEADIPGLSHKALSKAGLISEYIGDKAVPHDFERSSSKPCGMYLTRTS